MLTECFAAELVSTIEKEMEFNDDATIFYIANQSAYSRLKRRLRAESGDWQVQMDHLKIYPAKDYWVPQKA